MIVSGRFKNAGDGGRRPLLFQEARERCDPFLVVAKYVMDRGSIRAKACDVEFGFPDIDANAHQWNVIHIR
jgi:hypothetical protein